MSTVTVFPVPRMICLTAFRVDAAGAFGRNTIPLPLVVSTAVISPAAAV